MKTAVYAVPLSLAFAFAGTSDAMASGNSMAQMYRELGIEVPDEDSVAQEAANYPLGSFENPVRAEDPEGQRAYLSRLRCSDGKRPRFQRSGNLGPGVYGYIVDNYVVDCGEAEPGRVNIVIDMYHDHVAKKAVPVFTIVKP